MPEYKRIGRENAEYQLVAALKENRQQRHKQGRFFVEGVRSINAVVAGGWGIDSFLFAPPLSGWAQGILRASRARRHIELSRELMEKLSDKDEPSELIALVTTPRDDLARIRSDKALAVVFDRPSSPGNLGTMIRSCDALGADGLVVTGHAADVYDPQTIRASMGSLFSLPVVRVDAARDLQPWIAGATVVGCSSDGDIELAGHDFARPTVVVLGNEARGLSAAARALCSVVVRIPMSGAADSLNVASAGAIVLYEVARQRRARPTT